MAVFLPDTENFAGGEAVVEPLRQWPQGLCSGGALPQRHKEGPADYEALFCWPTVALEQVRACMGATENAPQAPHTIVLTTSYSGIGCAEAAAAMLAHAVSMSGIPDTRWGKLEVYRSIENTLVCQALLHSHKEASRPTHVFSDLLTLLHDTTLSSLQGLQRRWLDTYRSRLRNVVGAAQRKELLAKCSATYIAQAMRVLKRNPPNTNAAACTTHERECPLCPVVEPGQLHIEVAGSTCVAWSAMGLCEGWLHESSTPFLCWVQLLLHHQPHLIVHECTPSFDTVTLAALLQPHYDVSFCIASPDDLGFPCRRARKYSVCVHRSKANLRCPLDRENFLRVFAREVCTDASLYFQAPTDVLKKHIAAMAVKLQIEEPDLADRFTMADLLPPGDRDRLRRYCEANEARLQAQHGEPRPRGPLAKDRDECGGGAPHQGGAAPHQKETVIVDLSQDPQRWKRPACPSLMPPLLQNSKMCELSTHCILLPLQHVVVQGFPVVELWDSPPHLPMEYFPFVRDLGRLFRKLGLTESTVRSVTGNSMHLGHIGAVLLFCCMGVQLTDVQQHARTGATGTGPSPEDASEDSAVAAPASVSSGGGGGAPPAAVQGSSNSSSAGAPVSSGSGGGAAAAASASDSSGVGAVVRGDHQSDPRDVSEDRSEGMTKRQRR